MPAVYYVSFITYAVRCYRMSFFCFQAEDGIRDLVRSRGLGDVYKRQELKPAPDGLRSADGSKIYVGRLISLDLQDTDIDLSLIHI